MSLADIINSLGHQAFSLLFVVLALPNCLPMPPPIPLICGLLLLGVALQITCGRQVPWIPRRLLQKSIARTHVVRAVDHALPYVRRLEKWSRRRFVFFETSLHMRLMGIVLMIISGSLLVAAPIIGQIPSGVAICLIGLGMVERDGLVVICGLIIGALGVSLSIGFAAAIVSGLTSFIGNIL